MHLIGCCHTQIIIIVVGYISTIYFYDKAKGTAYKSKYKQYK